MKAMGQSLSLWYQHSTNFLYKFCECICIPVLKLIYRKLCSYSGSCFIGGNLTSDIFFHGSSLQVYLMQQAHFNKALSFQLLGFIF